MVTFVAIVEAGSISKASVALHRTQAAISIQLKKMEESVGKPLLSRSYNSASLTHEGETLLAYARKILALADEAYHAVNDEDIAGPICQRSCRLKISEDNHDPLLTRE